MNDFTNQPIIVARELTKIYRTEKTRVRALNRVNIDVNEKEFIAIVGTSGSGKSTLLSLLAGLEKPSSGRIMISGRGIHQMNEEQLVRFRLRHTGFIFQNFNMLETLTMVENVSFPLVAQGVKRNLRTERAEELLAQVGLKNHIYHRPMELSGGQQQRAAIARAIITEPDIIFADEPTGNLDSKTADDIMQLLAGLNSTILMVTHDKERAQAADRVVHIEDGEII